MKRFFLIYILFLTTLAAFAQSGYRVVIKQVFPKQASVYSNVFDIREHMDKAIASKTAELRGKNANYKIFIKKPSGSETRLIQNIVWIESINGKKSYHQKKTSPLSSYKEPTMWQGYACTVDGTCKGAVTKVDFIYRVSIVGGANEFETDYLSLENARTKAKKAFAESKAIDRLVEVIIYKDKEKMEKEALSNKKEYQAFKNKQKHTEDSLEAVRKEQLSKSSKLSIVNGGVEKFKKDMILIKDSLKNDGIRCCWNALNETVNVIPDNIFISQKCDTLYNSVLGDILSDKRMRELYDDMQTEIKGTDMSKRRIILLDYTKLIEKISEKPSKFKVDGVKYAFYGSADDGVRVKDGTKEFEVGAFKSDVKDGKIICQPKKGKTRKYPRNDKN